MEEINILTSIVDTLTGKPVYRLTIPIKWLPDPPKVKRSLWDWLTRKPMPVLPDLETYRTLEFWPCVVGNQYRVAGRAVLLPKEIFEDQSYNIDLIREHQPNIVYMVAAALQNNHLEPDPELITFIERNLDGIDLINTLIASFQALNMQSFTNSIVLMKGAVSILKPKASPNDGSELIASHTLQSDHAQSISDGMSGA